MAEVKTSETKVLASEEEIDTNSLSLAWVFGFNIGLPGVVHSLSDSSREALFYVSANTALIYDIVSGQQFLLQGHCNVISSVCVSSDNRLIVTADRGVESMIVIWDAFNATPVKVIYQPHPEGVAAMDLTPDSRYLMTLSSDSPQTISVWEWAAGASPVASAQLPRDSDYQHFLKFNPSDIRDVVTNGEKKVMFWAWNNDTITAFQPTKSGTGDLKRSYGQLTQSAFIPLTSRVVTATSTGDVVLYDYPAKEMDKASGREVVKIIKLSPSCGISFISVKDQYVVTGCKDGTVKFFDFQFRIVGWFEDLNAGPITSISFAMSDKSDTKNPSSDAEAEQRLVVPDFIVGTSSGKILRVRSRIMNEANPENRRGEGIIEGFAGAVRGLDTHPFLSQFVVGCSTGALELWDYDERTLLMTKSFPAVSISCVAFDKHGKNIAVGMTNGTLKILTAHEFQELHNFKNSLDCIIFLEFSPDSQYLATADSDRCVSLYRYYHRDEDVKNELEWVYLGKSRSHAKQITSIHWGLEHKLATSQRIPHLFSIGRDRMLLEYDVIGSSITNGLKLKSSGKIEQSAIPTAVLYMSDGRNESIIIANDEYKFKRWCGQEQKCLQTILGPTYGGSVTKMIPLPENKNHDPPLCQDQYIAYSTDSKVIGLLKLPFDGNPNKTIGLISHPAEISAMACTCDGRYLLTAGGDDKTVNLWAFGIDAFESTIAHGGTDVDSYIGLVDGGKDSAFYDEIVSYFYYSQLRTQGQDTTNPRKITGYITTKETVHLMQALGYFPTQKEIENLAEEIKNSQYEETGEFVDRVDFNTFIKLYINHRPVSDFGKEDIVEAFRLLGADADGGLSRDVLIAKLQNSSLGEALSEKELINCFQSLVGGPVLEHLPRTVTADTFAQDILGLVED